MAPLELNDGSIVVTAVRGVWLYSVRLWVQHPWKCYDDGLVVEGNVLDIGRPNSLRS